MSEMVERVACAIYAKLYGRVDGMPRTLASAKRQGAASAMIAERLARVAILALREPSEGMMNASMAAAGWDMPVHPENQQAPYSARREYQAMIDAALGCE